MTAPRVFLPVTRRYASALDRVRRATPRERLMLAGLAIVGTLILISVGIRFLKTSRAAWNEVSEKSKRAAVFLGNAPAVDKALAEKSAKLAGRRMSASDLLAAVDTLARESGLNADSTTPRSERSGGLTLLRAKVSLRAPSLQKLMDFDDRLRLRGDGLVVERVTIDARDNGELSAVYEILSCQPSE